MARCFLCRSPFARVIDPRYEVDGGRLVKRRVVRCAPPPAGCGQVLETEEVLVGVTHKLSAPVYRPPRRRRRKH